MAAYNEARSRLFEKFDKMKPGKPLGIAKEANGRPDLYIAICKEYIDAGNNHYEFSSDYSTFRRLRHIF